MLLDYHVHTWLCKHATGEPADYVRTAIANGLSEIGFSDHCPWPSGFDPKYRMEAAQFPSYRKLVSDLGEAFPQIKIRYGLEADWVHGRMDEVFRNLAGESFDYLIGSVHYTDDFPFDNPDFADRWNEKELVEKIWKRYFELMLEMSASGMFDILGHFDLPKKFGYYPKSMDKIRVMVADVFRAAAENDMAIEINTAGLRKPVMELYPSPEILRMARDAGVMLVLGSDSHAPGEVAANFTEAVALARSAGYSEICSFAGRKPSLFSIG